MAKVLITEKIHEIFSQTLQKDGFVCHYRPDINYEEFEEIVENYQGIVIRSKFSINKTVLDKAIKLKFIARAGAGLENVDTQYAKTKNIACINSPEGNRGALGEHTVGLLIALFSNICKANYQVKNGIWQRNQNRGYEIQGKTVGIIGYGNMGGAFARRLSGFGAKVIAYDKYRKNYSDKYATACELSDLQNQADVLSLHVPYTPETNTMVNEAFINTFKKNFYLLNTARGQVVQTSALVNALKSGKILGAGLDVLEFENTNFENLFNSEISQDFKYLLSTDNVILTPHIAGRKYEAERKMAEIMATKIRMKFPEFTH